MWRQLTEQGRRALFAAQEEADRRGENRVQPEHLLLGVLRDENSGARRLLEEMGTSPDEIAEETRRLLVPGPGRDGAPLRLDARSAQALKLAQSEAERVRAKFVGPEHLLLGLMAADAGAAGAVFRAHGPTLEETRRALLRAPDADAPGAAAASVVAQRQRERPGDVSPPGTAVWRFLAVLVLLVVLVLLALLGR
jgi:ATP-dependent Clp protease ATP-binding subunit ClpA